MDRRAKAPLTGTHDHYLFRHAASLRGWAARRQRPMIPLRAMFGKKKARKDLWATMTPYSLSERTEPLLRLTIEALEAASELCVSPGSDKSVEFRDQTDRWIRSLCEDAPKGYAIDRTREQYAQSAREFGMWQRDLVSSLEHDLVEAAREISGNAKQAMELGGDATEAFETLTYNLERAAESNTIEKIRDQVRRETSAARRILREQRAEIDRLKEEYTKAVGEMEKRVRTMESTGTMDHLTGTANRAALDFFLASLCRRASTGEGPFALAMLDLDDFKPVNDRLGHEAGDLALQHVVSHLRTSLGPGVYLARFGGDEFAIAYQGDAVRLANLLAKAAAALSTKPVEYRGQRFSVGMSSGVTAIQGDDTPSRALRRADAALLRAKQGGKNDVQTEAA